MQLCIQVVYFCGWAESLGMGTPSTESQCCLVTFIVTNVAPDNHCELDLQSKSVQIPNHDSPEPWSSQTNQVSLLNHTSIVLEEPFLRIFVALRTLLVFLVCCSGELWPCVLCLAVILLKCSLGLNQICSDKPPVTSMPQNCWGERYCLFILPVILKYGDYEGS